VECRGDLGEDMMAGANEDAERVGGALVAEAWARARALSHRRGGDGGFFGGSV
jgi:hypothetical protein